MTKIEAIRACYRFCFEGRDLDAYHKALEQLIAEPGVNVDGNKFVGISNPYAVMVIDNKGRPGASFVRIKHWQEGYEPAKSQMIPSLSPIGKTTVILTKEDERKLLE